MLYLHFYQCYIYTSLNVNIALIANMVFLVNIASIANRVFLLVNIANIALIVNRVFFRCKYSIDSE